MGFPFLSWAQIQAAKEGGKVKRAPDAARDIFGFLSKQSFVRKWSTGVMWKPADWYFWTDSFPPTPDQIYSLTTTCSTEAGSLPHFPSGSPWLRIFTSMNLMPPDRPSLAKRDPGRVHQLLVTGYTAHRKSPVVQAAESQPEKTWSVHLSWHSFAPAGCQLTTCVGPSFCYN